MRSFPGRGQCFYRIHNHNRPNTNIIENFQNPIHHSMRSFWDSNNPATLQYLLCLLISLINHQMPSGSGKEICNSDKHANHRDNGKSQGQWRCILTDIGHLLPQSENIKSAKYPTLHEYPTGEGLGRPCQLNFALQFLTIQCSVYFVDNCRLFQSLFQSNTTYTLLE